MSFGFSPLLLYCVFFKSGEPEAAVAAVVAAEAVAAVVAAVAVATDSPHNWLTA